MSVRDGAASSHCKLLLCAIVCMCMEKYIKDGTKMVELLQRLLNGKNLFLITNSAFWFVQVLTCYM